MLKSIVDRLEDWWQLVKDQFPHIHRWVINADNGPENHSRRNAFTIARNVVLLLIGALLIGGSLLDFFGVSLAVVRIAGGIVVFHAA